MTPKEKAIQLYERNKYLLLGSGHSDQNFWAKAFAKETVNEIINSNPHSNPFNTEVHSTISFWLQVKKQINRL
jgi:hypothetical protein